MTTEQLRVALRASPFRPFRIRMADQRQFEVPHPDFASVSPVGRTAVVYHPDGAASIIDLLLMTELDFSPPATATRS